MPKPIARDVWRYDYLWRWQHERGETAGRKPRPVAVVAVLIQRQTSTNLFLLPITGSRPDPIRLCVEIPEIERRRAELDGSCPHGERKQSHDRQSFACSDPAMRIFSDAVATKPRTERLESLLPSIRSMHLSSRPRHVHSASVMS